ncbi:paraquat-inducible protein A [Microbulbifer flavimaris]|uniref:Paraquat-inducible protein A n=1 Tax=Microbulbifer flavimaris TaxID=1781068 RepID=A0ABX4I1X0_9GAMM|nr:MULTISPECIES: paraquat-inducible protein A [Microbulbifer]KUJ83632.1 paraquat-inducible protein A [Microbulbifer sp. ZGT114]PCO05793.1 paraquat-inducible protein A [Microbulbifer flavimaris]
MQQGATDSASGWQRACHECDLLLGNCTAPPGGKLVCPRCAALINRNPARSIHYTAALSISGLLLFIPAATLPLLNFSIIIVGSENTLFNGVFSLFKAGYIWLASLVLFCSVVAPFTRFLLLAFISLGCLWGALDRPVSRAVRWYQHIREWAMLDVYMLGVLVALIKMQSLGKMVVESGLYCFVGLMVLSNLTLLSFDQQSVWRRMARRRAAAAASQAGEVTS